MGYTCVHNSIDIGALLEVVWKVETQFTSVVTNVQQSEISTEIRVDGSSFQHSFIYKEAITIYSKTLHFSWTDAELDKRSSKFNPHKLSTFKISASELIQSDFNTNIVLQML